MLVCDEVEIGWGGCAGPLGLARFVRQSLLLTESYMPYQFVIHQLVPPPPTNTNVDEWQVVLCEFLPVLKAADWCVSEGTHAMPWSLVAVLVAATRKRYSSPV